jgi:hypothetical protein
MMYSKRNIDSCVNRSGLHFENDMYVPDLLNWLRRILMNDVEKRLFGNGRYAVANSPKILRTKVLPAPGNA